MREECIVIGWSNVNGSVRSRYHCLFCVSCVRDPCVRYFLITNASGNKIAIAFLFVVTGLILTCSPHVRYVSVNDHRGDVVPVGMHLACSTVVPTKHSTQKVT